MRIRNLLAFTVLTLVGATACEMGPLAPDTDRIAPTGLPAKKGNKPDKGTRPPRDEPEPEPEPTPQYVWYQVSAYDDADPLYRFGIDNELGIIRLETDPSVTSWGTDYWGYWSDPFPFDGSSVSYTNGLSHTTYTFVPSLGGGLDVTKTVVVDPYLGGEPTTTVKHVGVFGRAG